MVESRAQLGLPPIAARRHTVRRRCTSVNPPKAVLRRIMQRGGNVRHSSCAFARMSQVTHGMIAHTLVKAAIVADYCGRKTIQKGDILFGMGYDNNMQTRTVLD